MAKFVQNDYDEIGLTFINDQETLKLFNELVANVQGKIILEGLKKAAKPILETAKTTFQRYKKNQSKTNYADLKKSARIKSRRKRKDELGVIVGFTREGYKYRWINWGTDDRFYTTKKNKKEKYVGKLEKTNFFFDAVDQSRPQAEAAVSQEIKTSLERTMKKYHAKNAKNT